MKYVKTATIDEIAICKRLLYALICPEMKIKTNPMIKLEKVGKNDALRKVKTVTGVSFKRYTKDGPRIAKLTIP